MVKVKNLTRRYGELVAVDNISFEISDGQIVGILGHNGAGKTTTLRMITGFLEPTSGSVEIDGANIDENRLKVQQNIGYLPENSPLYHDMTVIEYLHYIADIRGVPEGDRKAAISETICKTKLQEKMKDGISTLSKGYRQRVSVAQAILHKPKILVLDEPTSGLDPSQIFEMRGLIRELSKKSTVIISTHILQEVEAICDRVIIINHGKIVKDATLSDLQGSNSISLIVKAPDEELRASLKNVKGVEEIVCLRKDQEFNQYKLKISGNWQDISPAIAGRAVEKGWPLYELKQERLSLENIFHQINEGVLNG